MQPGRDFIREKNLILIIKKLTFMGKVSQSRKIKILVFTDLVLLVEPVPETLDKLLLVSPPIFLDITPKPIVQVVTAVDNEFTLVYNNESFQLSTKDKDERDECMKILLSHQLRGEGTLMKTRLDRAIILDDQAVCMQGNL